MNNIIAHLLSNLTCSMRFEGSLNIDLNEVTMNLVPYPEIHFLQSAISPLYSLSNKKINIADRGINQLFSDCIRSDT